MHRLLKFSGARGTTQLQQEVFGERVSWRIKNQYPIQEGYERSIRRLTSGLDEVTNEGGIKYIYKYIFTKNTIFTD